MNFTKESVVYMSNILLDDWALHFTFRQILLNNKDDPKEEMTRMCMSNLSNGLVLWDRINRFPNHNVETHLSRLDKNDVVMQLSKLMDYVDLPEYHEFSTTLSTREQYVQQLDTREHCPDDYTTLLERSKLYLDWSNKLGINYLPHPARAQHISENNLLGVFSRDMLFSVVDREVQRYYDEINKKLGRPVFNCYYPILYDYIRKNCDTLSDELSAALFIREDKDIMTLRQSLDKLDTLINSGNIQYLNIAINQIEDLSKTISNAYSKTTKLGEFTIGLSPSLKIPIALHKTKKILNMTFLTKLVDFGAKERLKEYLFLKTT